MAGPGTRQEYRPGLPSMVNVANGPTRRCPACGSTYPLDFVVCPKDATTLDRPADLGDDPLLGEVLAGTFCITGLIGEGGMGRVYEAEHVRLPKRFAIKVMLEELVKHPDALSRFEREAQAVARVTSEHVIEVVDLVRLKDGRPCLVTELLEGEELGDLLDKSGRMPLAQAVLLCRQVCRGLAAAHAVGVVHRDLKPSNLYLVKRADSRPFIKILDFGVAKLSDGAALTRTGMVVGTPAYMSPEQARGSADVDERADVYSLGAVLFHMVTGTAPFVGDEPGVVLTRVLTEDPPRPRDLNRAIPDGLEHLIQRAMARTPEGRPRSVIELEQELGDYDSSGMDAMSMRRPNSDPRPSLAMSDTVHVAITPVETSVSAARGGARFSRFGSTLMAFVWAGLIGASVLAASASAVRIYSGRYNIGDTELVLLTVVSAIASGLVLVSTSKSLLSRWRSAPAIDRLGSAFASASFWLLLTTGFTLLGWIDYGIVGILPDAELIPYIHLGIALVPIVVGFAAFIASIRKAGRLT